MLLVKHYFYPLQADPHIQDSDDPLKDQCYEGPPSEIAYKIDSAAKNLYIPGLYN